MDTLRCDVERQGQGEMRCPRLKCASNASTSLENERKSTILKPRRPPQSTSRRSLWEQRHRQLARPRARAKGRQCQRPGRNAGLGAVAGWCWHAGGGPSEAAGGGWGAQGGAQGGGDVGGLQCRWAWCDVGVVRTRRLGGSTRAT